MSLGFKRLMSQHFMKLTNFYWTWYKYHAVRCHPTPPSLYFMPLNNTNTAEARHFNDGPTMPYWIMVLKHSSKNTKKNPLK